MQLGGSYAGHYSGEIIEAACMEEVVLLVWKRLCCGTSTSWSVWLGCS